MASEIIGRHGPTGKLIKILGGLRPLQAPEAASNRADRWRKT